MKGYVSVTFTDKQKQELFDLYNKINEFSKKPKEEVFGYTTFTTEHKFLWWKWTRDVKLQVFNCPEELKVFFYYLIFSSEDCGFRVNATGRALADIVNLVRSGNPVLLGEDLSGVLYWLQDGGYVSKHQFKQR